MNYREDHYPQETIRDILTLDENSEICNTLGEKAFLRLYFFLHKIVTENNPDKEYILYLSIDKKHSLKYFINSNNMAINSLNTIQFNPPVNILKDYFYTILSGDTKDILPNIYGVLLTNRS